MAVGVACERSGAKGITEPGCVDRPWGDERKPMVAGETEHWVQTIRDERGLPVSDVVSAQVERCGPTVPRSEILEQLDSGSG